MDELFQDFSVDSADFLGDFSLFFTFFTLKNKMIPVYIIVIIYCIIENFYFQITTNNIYALLFCNIMIEILSYIIDNYKLTYIQLTIVRIVFFIFAITTLYLFQYLFYINEYILKPFLFIFMQNSYLFMLSEANHYLKYLNPVLPPKHSEIRI